MKIKILIAGLGVFLLFWIRSRAQSGRSLFPGALRVNDISKSLPRNGAWKKRALSGVTDITLHHAASSNTATAEDFARYHITGKGWPGIGYHYVIDRAGNVFQTNDLTDLSYHNGYNNTAAVGVSLVGNMDNEPMTADQLSAFLALVPEIRRQVPTVRRLVGHKEYKGATACPGRYVSMGYLRTQTGLAGFGGGVARAFAPESAEDMEADN